MNVSGCKSRLLYATRWRASLKVASQRRSQVEFVASKKVADREQLTQHGHNAFSKRIVVGHPWRSKPTATEALTMLIWCGGALMSSMHSAFCLVTC